MGGAAEVVVKASYKITGHPGGEHGHNQSWDERDQGYLDGLVRGNIKAMEPGPGEAESEIGKVNYHQGTEGIKNPHGPGRGFGGGNWLMSHLFLLNHLFEFLGGFLHDLPAFYHFDLWS